MFSIVGALRALSTKLVGTAPTSSSTGDVLKYIADHADVSATGRALLGADNAAAARTVIGAPAKAAAQADSTAADAAALTTDFNALLAKLRASGALAEQ